MQRRLSNSKRYESVTPLRFWACFERCSEKAWRLKPGDPLSQNQITGSQKRLYDLGIFAKVNAAIQNPDCRSSPPSEILFAGMAPGLVGIYQVDIRLPLQATLQTNNGSGFVLFDCGDGGVGFYAFSVPIDLSNN